MMNSNFLFLCFTYGFLVYHHLLAEQLTEPSVLSLNACSHDASKKCGTIEFIGHTFVIPTTAQTTTFTTRVYKDGADDDLDNIRLGAGPSLRVERGITYEITFINQLQDESDNNPPFPVPYLNGYNSPNTTSLHTHGCHISPELPADFVLQDVAPGGSKTYSYSIPADHCGGIHFYHPHHHGSAALQVGGGAYGAFIIEDSQAEDGLPDWYNDMRELIAIIGSFDLQFLTGIFAANVDYLTSADPLSSFYLINGMYKPEIYLTQNEWLKVKFGHIDPVNDVQVEIDSTQCTIYLLGKDGILLHGETDSTPRLIASNTLYFHQAARAEIAISCDLGIGETVDIKIENDVIATFVITESNASPAPSLTPFTPIRPAYLTSLLNYNGDWQQYPTNSNGNDNDETQDYFTLSLSAKTVNGEKLSLGMVLGAHLVNMTADMPQKWKIRSSSIHPFHMHVHQVQIADDVGRHNAMGPDGWTERGDWIDTVTTNVQVRFWAATFYGNIFLHCHNLPHEDLGAVAIAFVYGGCNAQMTQSMDSNHQCRFLSEVSSYTAAAQKNNEIDGSDSFNTYEDDDGDTFYEILSVNAIISVVCSSLMAVMVYWCCLRKRISLKNENQFSEHVSVVSDVVSYDTKQDGAP